MSVSYTPTYVGGICESCHTGELYQYGEDPRDQLRCGRCGELEVKSVPDEVINAEAKPRTNRRKTA